jgi:NADPH-dependent 2,4-dienoyl-CoA reductase/sulfur reductase-like enzyme
MKTIIIGGVAAGMSAASKLNRLDKNREIIVYEKTKDLSYGGCGMPYYLGNVIKDEDKLIARTKEQFEEKGINVFIEHEVIDVLPKEKMIKVKNLKTGEILNDHYDQLVITTGTKPYLTNVPGSDQANLFVLNQLEDARMIKEHMDGVKEIAIIGGGYIGLEIAENFAHLGIKVHIIEMAKQLLTVYDESIAKKAKEILENLGINIYLNEALKSYKKENNKTKVITENREIKVDMVIESIGVKPNTDFLKSTDIKMLKNGAIITDAHMKTNIKDIYAGGDCASYDHLLTNEKAFVPLGTHANKTGRIIAENIAGLNTKFKGIIGSNIIKIDDYAFAKTGLGIDEARKHGFNYDYVDIKAKNQSGYYPGAEPIFIRLVFNPKDKVIKGAQLYGKKGVSDRINIMAIAILNKMTADDFAQSDLAYAPPFSPVWDPLLVAANQIK